MKYNSDVLPSKVRLEHAMYHTPVTRAAAVIDRALSLCSKSAISDSSSVIIPLVYLSEREGRIVSDRALKGKESALARAWASSACLASTSASMPLSRALC